MRNDDRSTQRVGADAEASGQTDLHIELMPRCLDRWHGTAAQLLAEGLIPREFQWPRGTQGKPFDHRGFECHLSRRKPPGMGRNGRWVDIDHWSLTRYCDERCTTAALKHQQQHELAEVEFRLSPAGAAARLKHRRAEADASFQAFKRRILTDQGARR